MELMLIRHGLPVRDEATSDPPLSAQGREQARRVGQWLSGHKIDAAFASTMRRAMETAEPFARLAGHEIATDSALVEFDRHSGAYIPMEELKRDDYPRWKAFVETSGDVDIAAFPATVVTALGRIIESHPGRRVAVFCHGGVINVWTAHVLGMAPRLFFEPAYASVHRYLCASSGQRNLVSLNETGHLNDPALA